MDTNDNATPETKTKTDSKKGKTKVLDALKSATPETLKSAGTSVPSKMVETENSDDDGVYVRSNGKLMKAPDMPGRMTVYNFQIETKENGNKRRMWKRIY